MGKTIVRTASLFLALAVILGAFGAHALKDRIADDLLEIYKTGVTYHFYHGLGLLLIGIVALQKPLSLMKWSAILLALGIVLFSGSLYVMAFTGLRWLGAVTPFGGVAFIVGWILLFLAFFRTNK
jgi:uncharacterized membrane protein YgdD (TMEM256/DUF423 family)